MPALGYLSRVVTIERLGDQRLNIRLIDDLTALVNRAYALAERGLWLDGVARTNADEMSQWAVGGEMVAALNGSDLVGAVRSNHRGDGESWFGALAVIPTAAGQGLGRALVEYVERDAAQFGSHTMELEVLTSPNSHPHLERLRAWYERLGYTETSRRGLLEVSPEEAPFMAVPIEAVVMCKPLKPTIE